MKALYLPMRHIIPLAFFIMISGAGFLQFLAETARSTTEVEKNIESYANFNGIRIAETLERFYLHNDDESAETALAMEGSQPDLRVALLIDDRGETLISTNYEYRGKKPLKEWDEERAGLIQSVKVNKHGYFRLTTDRLSAISAFAVNLGARSDELRPSRMGVLYMEYDLALLKQQARRKGLENFYTDLWIDGLVSLCAWAFLTLALTRRMRRMADSVSRLASGDYSARVDLAGGDELAAVGATFNQMAEKLEKNIREMKKTDRMMRMLSDCNQALIRFTDKIGLLQEICRIVTHVGGYRMAWVGYKEEKGEKRVRPMARVGFEEGYLDNVTVTWGDDEFGRGPTGVAIKTRKPAFMNDIANNPDFAPWREEALKRGYASSISIPLIHGEEVMGTLNIYSSEKETFDEEEVKLLKELGDDLAFGIMVIRGQTARKMAEVAQKESEAKHSSLVESITDCVCHIGLDGKIIYMNPAGRALNGIKPDAQVAGIDCAFDVDEMFVNSVRKAVVRTLSKGLTTRLEYMSRGKPGREKWWYSTMNPIRDYNGDIVGIVRISRDITELKLEEEIRDEAFSRLQKIASQVPGIVFQYRLRPDGSSCFPYASEAIRDIYRVSPEDAAKDAAGVFCVLHPDDYDGFVASIQESARDLSQWTYEYRVKYDDGIARWLSGNAAPQREADGSVLWHGFIRDITARKQREEALSQSEAKFRAIFDSTSEAVMLLDEKSFLDCNKATLEVFGCATREEFCSKHPADLSPPLQPCGTDSMALSRRHIAIAMEKGSHHFEWIHTRADNGEAFPAEVLLNSMNLDGKPVLEAVVRNISERKRAEEALRDSEEKYHALFEKHMDMILVYDAQTRSVEDVNQACIETYGYSKEEFLKLSVTDISAGPDETEAILTELLDRAVNDSFGEIRIPAMYAKRKDGSIFPLELGLNHFISHGRKKIVISSRDITDAVRAEKNMELQRQQLIQADRLKSLGTIVAGVAHEINNPNSFIMFNSQMVKKAWDGVMPALEKYYEENGDFLAGGMPFTRLRASAPRLIDDMLEGSRRINTIVDKLKGFARQGEKEKLAPIDINTVARESVWLLSPLIARSTRKFVTDYAEGLPPVMGDLRGLEQVAVNLITNALHSLTSDECVVKISTRFDTSSNRVVMEVMDNGVGIPAEALGKIMDPFFTTKRNTGGTGLGLSISYGIITEHKGTIVFSSEPGKGTTVTVSIPAYLAE